MCTILYLFGVHPTFPLVLAANRDEFYARPATYPSLVGSDGNVLAGLDTQAGGTWMGANREGLVVGVTNQRTRGPVDRSLQSRGQLVMDALASSDPEQVVARLAGVDARRFNEFNLLFGNASRLLAAYGRRDQARVEIEELPAGTGVLPNDRIGATGFPKARRAASLMQGHTQDRWPQLADHLASVLGDHALPEQPTSALPVDHSPLTSAELRSAQAICVHGEQYGTRSSTIVALQPGRVAHYLYSPGAPCVTGFEDVGELL